MRTLPFGSALTLLALAAGPATAPVGSVYNPRQVTSADKGPDIDPAKLAASLFNGVPVFRTFRSFVSMCYAVPGVWLCAANDDQTLYDKNVGFDYPPFYRPTWGEVFDHVARQMRCKWAFDPANRQFTFEPTDAPPPPFAVDLAPGWRCEDRGLYVWHAPADQPFGLDVYDYGRYTLDPAHPELAAKIREHFALLDVAGWPNPPRVGQMSTLKVAGADALYLRADTPRPGGVWRQWSLVVGGHAVLIVSAMPKDREAALAPAIDQMIASFGPTPTTVPVR